MIVDHTAAVFDTDFTNHIYDTKLAIEKIGEILCQLLRAMKLRGIMHPLVYKHEFVQLNGRTAALFEQEIIAVPALEDLFQQDEVRRTYYCDFLVPQLYRQMNGKSLPPDWNILSSWNAGQNLGEIHSIAMCLICGCGIFLSDDSDAKKIRNLIAEQMPNSIQVYNRAEVMDQFGKLAGISRSDRKALAHKRV